MIDKVETFLKKHNIVLKSASIVAAVSTGVDSMTMLDILVSIREKYNITLFVAHVNHCKREQSKEEEKYIKSYCLAHNIKCYTYKLKTSSNKNFQDYAHKERNKFFRLLMEQLRGDYLFLAHHANDNIETIIMRLMRGSNLKGYAGMAPVIRTGHYTIVRPFLEISKSDILEYACLRQIKYYEDETNISDMYTRNRIRKNVIPALFKEHAGILLKFQEFSDTLFSAWDIIEANVNEFIREYVQINKDRIAFSRPDFDKLSPFLKREVLFLLLKPYRFGKCNVEEIVKLIQSRKKNHMLFYKNSFTFVKEYDMVYFYKRKLVKPECDFIVHSTGDYVVNDSISVSVIKNVQFNILKHNEIWYNSAMLPFRIRTRKPGDRILLSTGYKKVKDILIDNKVGIIKRNNVLIIEKDEEILAMIGIAISEHLKKIELKDILIRVEYYEA